MGEGVGQLAGQEFAGAPRPKLVCSCWEATGHPWEGSQGSSGLGGWWELLPGQGVAPSPSEHTGYMGALGSMLTEPWKVTARLSQRARVLGAGAGAADVLKSIQPPRWTPAKAGEPPPAVSSGALYRASLINIVLDLAETSGYQTADTDGCFWS